jgi:magnesium chelatase family protein
VPSARTYSATVVGITGHVLAIEAETSPGLPVTLLLGFSHATWREQRDRVRAVVVNCGFAWPAGEVTIGARPWALPKHDGTDLAVAVAALAASGAVPPGKLDTTLFYGELGPDGKLSAVPGSLPVVQAAAASDQFTTVILADGDPAAAARTPGVHVITATEFGQVIRWLRGGPQPTARRTAPLARPVPDMADLHLPAAVRAAAEIAAAGAHHLSLLDRTGGLAPMLACRLPHIMPRLDDEAARDVAAIWSAAGLLAPREPLPAAPPLAAPHHTASVAEMIGGGPLLSPGAASLAHHGVLFLENAPEFDRKVGTRCASPWKPATSSSAAGTRSPRRCPPGSPSSCPPGPVHAETPPPLTASAPPAPGASTRPGSPDRSPTASACASRSPRPEHSPTLRANPAR